MHVRPSPCPAVRSLLPLVFLSWPRRAPPPRPTGPLLSLTPERVATATLRARRASRGASGCVMQPVGRGPDGDGALLPPRPQAARGQRQPDDVADRQVGHGARRLQDLEARRRPDPGHAPRDRHGAAARGQAGEGRRRRRCARGPGARGPAVRLLQQRLAAKGYVVGQRGLFDQRTARAVLAFRKVTGMARTTRRRHRASSRRCWPARARSRCAIPTTASTSRPTSRAR